ncbi:MAG: sigma-54-dependent Fis family transcriptional regulator [Candidatus Omnitrophica bacterium]|nr:sigma-54-dependent Fis family transcriptional regulator [Candidatus Omnitrophota bacterium]
MPQLLIVDDDADFQRMLQTRLQQEGYAIRSAFSCAECCSVLKEIDDVDAILLDYELPDGDGIALLPEILAIDAGLPVILVTAFGSIERAVEAMRRGAYDFSAKPIDWNRLLVTVKNAVEHRRLSTRIQKLERSRRSGLNGLIGGSAEMQVVYRIIETVAPTQAPVLITGESGTGKELIARAIHDLSPRRGKELIDVNCAAIPKDLLESELFGHEPNSFTGARERYIGRCERAHLSTLFLDEIAEMEYSLQAKILRFLQEHALYRVGGSDKISVDIRILSATNRDPAEAMNQHQLREDLFYRLNVVLIEAPPLRDHADDVPELAEHFLKKYAREHDKPLQAISDDALNALCSYAWPGNVRELENCIQQSVVLGNGEILKADMLPKTIQAHSASLAKKAVSPSPKPIEREVIAPFEQVERDAIDNALRITRGSVPNSSNALHLSQATIYRKIREYNLNIKKYKEDDSA